MMIIQYLADRIGGPSALDNISFQKPGASFDTLVWIKALTMARQLVKENAFQSGFPSFNYDTGDASQLLYGGRAAMMFMGVWQFGMAKSQAPSFLKDMSFFPVPVVPGGKGTVNDLVGNPTNFYSVSSYSKNKAAAILLVNDQTEADQVPDALVSVLVLDHEEHDRADDRALEGAEAAHEHHEQHVGRPLDVEEVLGLVRDRRREPERAG